MPLIVATLFVAFHALALPARSQAPVTEPPRVVQTHIGLDLAIDYDAGTLAGTARLTFENRGAHPVESIPLQLGRLMTVTGVRAADGSPLEFSQSIERYEDWPLFQVNQVYASLPQPLEPGAGTTLAVEYEGILVGYAETGMRYILDRVDRDFTIIRSDALAFPVIATPSLARRRSAPREDFLFDAVFRVPAGQVVAAAVEPLNVEERDGRTVWRFRGSEPVPFLNIAVAPYGTLSAPGVRIFHFPADSAGADVVLRSLVNATAALEEWFGPKSRDGAVTIIEIPEGFGSQASLTGGIIQTADAFRSTDGLPQLYHELVHLWHPSDTEIPSPRWNEGLATFLQFRLAGRLDGTLTVDSAASRTVATLLSRYDENAPVAEIPMASYGSADMTDLSYRAGHLLFYVLYRTLGTSEFDRLMAGYFEASRESGSDTRGLVDYLTRNASVDLRPVFEDWMYSTRWFHRLRANDSLEEMIADYSQ